MLVIYKVHFRMFLNVSGSLKWVFVTIYLRTSFISRSFSNAERISSMLIALGDICSTNKLTYQSAQFYRCNMCCNSVSLERETAKF